MTPYRVAPAARRDLGEIWDYIARDNPSAADRMPERFRARFSMLSRQPLIGEPRDDLRPNLRSFSVQRYVIYYQLIEDYVEIVRVLHGARDAESLL